MTESLVLDAGAAVEILDGEAAEAGERRRRLARAAAIHVPIAFHHEVADVLRKRHLRELGDARLMSADADDIPTHEWAWEDLRDRVWELAANVATRDACYVAVAELTGSTLVTTDRRLASAPGIRCAVEVW